MKHPSGPHHQEPHLPERGGYAYEFRGRNWRLASDDRWDIVVYTPTGREKIWSWRRIDDGVVIVFRASPRKFIAVTAQTVGMSDFANRVLGGGGGHLGKRSGGRR